jgi:hypothetical protein
MSHWALLDENNFVITVIPGDNDDINGDEGHKTLVDRHGGIWVKTSYNTHRGEHLLGGVPLRKNYAGPGYYYDDNLDAFIPPKPFASWSLDEETCSWQPPVNYPTDALLYTWDEEAKNWVEALN